MSITKRDLFNVWFAEKDQNNKSNAVISYIFVKIGTEDDITDDYKNKLKQTAWNFVAKLSEKWAKTNRTRSTFEIKFGSWLDEIFVLPPKNPSVFLEEDLNEGPSTSKKGRPAKPFTEGGQRMKLSKTKSLLTTYSPQELQFAAASSYYKTGKRIVADVIKNIDISPNRPSKIKKMLETPNKEPIPYTREEALAMYIDGRYSKSSYVSMRLGAKERNADIYPSYEELLNAKKDCYPRDGVKISEISAEVALQSLVDHTAKRLIKLERENVKEFTSSSLMLTYKWGCDGSSGHSTYKQPYQEHALETDQHLFIVCLVPLELKNENNVIWQNPRPSSTRFCRPIKLIFQRENSALITQEIEQIQSQIATIVPTIIEIENNTIHVNHHFFLTMIDGKVFSTIANLPSQRCGICGAPPTIMNDLKKIKELKVNENLYEHGISTLHAWIRSLECILHIAYKVDLKKWQARGEQEKALVELRKNKIIDLLKTKMNLLVDIPKPGYGTTNDGNTARRFFQQPRLASEITGVDENLIRRLGVILRTMASGYEINAELFRSYAFQTAELYVEQYKWYYMPSSLHKILIHGADIIQKAALPIGILSEEALESRNKDIRYAREHHARKMSRESNIQDVFNNLLFSSDPYISSILKKTLKKRSEPLCKESIALISEEFTIDELNDIETSQDEII